MSIAAYGHYRTTGDRWLAVIPEHWTLAKCGHRYEVLLGKMLDGARVTGRNSGRYLRNVDVQWDRISEDDLPEMDFAPFEVVRYSVRKGDLMVCEGGEPGRCAIWDRDYSCFYQKALHRLRPLRSHRDLPRYMFYNVAVAATQCRFEAGSGKATIAHLPAETFRQERFAFPPLDEQTQIARFLDYETARIDALIEKQQQLIALLKEKRQAVISHAVTKGLNPNAPLRDSGVEWLGMVPAHWEVVRLKHLLALDGIQMGPFGASLTNVLREVDTYRVYGQANTISGDFTMANRWLNAAQYAPLSHYRLRPGDIVLTRKGSLGNCRVVPSNIAPGIMDSDTIRVRVDHAKIDVNFLSVLMHDANYVSVQIEFNRRGAILPGLNTSVVGNLVLCVPPVREQLDVLSVLRKKNDNIESAAARAADAIELLQERRTALISAAVTGKIDVRGWKPPNSDTEQNVA